MSISAFKPYYFATGSVTLSGASQRVTLPQPARTGDVIKVLVSGSDAAFIKQGDSSVTAAGTDMPQLGNSCELYSLDVGVTDIAIYGANGTTVVYVTMGTGL